MQVAEGIICRSDFQSEGGGISILDRQAALRQLSIASRPDQPRVRGGRSESFIENADKSYSQQKRTEDRRQQLRNNAMPAKQALWTMLKKSALGGRKFRRQHSVGVYIVDFYCPAERLAIELDGKVHNDPTRATYDLKREEYLRGQGIRVVHVENRMVFENPEALQEYIASLFGQEDDHP